MQPLRSDERSLLSPFYEKRRDITSYVASQQRSTMPSSVMGKSKISFPGAKLKQLSKVIDTAELIKLAMRIAGGFGESAVPCAMLRAGMRRPHL